MIKITSDSGNFEISIPDNLLCCMERTQGSNEHYKKLASQIQVNDYICLGNGSIIVETVEVI